MKLLIALGTTALLTAACAASATVTGGGAGAARSANTINVVSGANAGTDVQGDLDVSRVNPLLGKPGTHQLPPAQPQNVLAPKSVPPIGLGGSRCGGLIGDPPVGSRGVGARGVKGPPLPACLAE